MPFHEAKTELNVTAFERLRWSILDDISSIQVMDDARSLNPQLLPFLSHSITQELATEAPLKEITMILEGVTEYVPFQYEESGEQDREPDPLVIRREDAGAVTVGDVVAQLHAYIHAHREVLLDCITQTYNATGGQGTVERFEGGSGEWGSVGVPLDVYRPMPEGTKVFFHGFEFSTIEPDVYAVHVSVWADGMWGKGVDYYWKHRANFRKCPLI